MKFICILFVLLTSFASKSVDPKTLTFDQVEIHVQNVNLLKEKKKLTKFESEGMTAWGTLTSYWGKNDLMLAESVYNAEAGFTKLTVYFNEGEICRIVTNRHRANWAQYERDHGNEEYDESKLTYTDEFYDYTFGKETTFRILKGDKMVPSEINKASLEEELAYVQLMKDFLDKTDN